jgi:hypothetical protein
MQMLRHDSLTNLYGHSKILNVARIRYPFDPDRLDAKHPLLVEDLIQMRREKQLDALLELGKMVAALKALGLDCGFAKKLHSSPIYELKSHSRGGQKGGARAYFFRGGKDDFMICHAECKPDKEANADLLSDTAYILEAYENNIPIFPIWMKGVISYDTSKS